MLDVSEVLLSPEFMQDVEVLRKANGRWEIGKFVQDEFSFTTDALVCIVSDKEINMIPEADRVSESRSFHTLDKIYLTESTDEREATSDIIVWKGEKYKIVSQADNSDYGYYKSYGVRIRGN